MQYSFQCTQCGRISESDERVAIGAYIQKPCPLCQGRIQRMVGHFVTKRPMDEHYNLSVGKPIRNMSQFKSELARKSDEHSARTGIDHNFVPVDYGDRDGLGVTDEGLDETAKVRRDGEG